MMQSVERESQQQANWAVVEASCQEMLDVIPAAVYTCDAQGLITYFNPSAETLWGRAPKLRDAVNKGCRIGHDRGGGFGTNGLELAAIRLHLTAARCATFMRPR